MALATDTRCPTQKRGKRVSEQSPLQKALQEYLAEHNGIIGPVSHPVEISDPYQIRCYPDIIAVLNERHIALETIRYIRIQNVSRVTEITDDTHHKAVREAHVTVTLHSGEQIPLPVFPRLIWQKHDQEPQP